MKRPDFERVTNYVMNDIDDWDDVLVTTWPDIMAYVNHLESLVAKLPKTADGVPITFAEYVFPPCGGQKIKASFRGGTSVYCFHGSCRDDGCQGEGISGSYHRVSDCYSTKESAEAMRCA